MGTIRLFVQDYIRLMFGRPLLGGVRVHTSEDRDARLTAQRFGRGNVALQTNRFVTANDLDKERDEVVESLIRN